MSDTMPVPRRDLLRLWFALSGMMLFMVISLVAGATRDGFDAWHQSVSALSLGPGGWVHQINMIVLGAVILATVVVWRRILAGGRGETMYPVLTGIAGVSIVVCGFVRQDPAPGYDPARLALTGPTPLGLVHLFAAAVGVACLALGLVVMASRFTDDPHWRGWAAYSRIMALLIVVCVTIYAIWSTQPSGFAGSFERVAIVLTPIWGLTFLARASAGTPFVVAHRDAPRSPDTVHALAIALLPTRVALCQAPVDAPVPAWTAEAIHFLTVSRTPTELSIMADEHVVPPTVSAQRGYRVLRVEGPLPLTLVGVIASLAGPLAEAGVPVLPIATYDTDYLLVRERDVPPALAALRRAGHTVVAVRPTA